MKHKRFKKAKDGEWIQPRMKNYLMACCDCGLVHRMDFRVAKSVKDGRMVIDHVQFRASRANGYTASQRKRHGIKVSL